MITSDVATPVEQVNEGPTEATRHLCAGAYVDEGFRDVVINEVCTAPYRRVAPSYGFDIVPVMRHAWIAAGLSAVLRAMVIAAVVVPALTGAVPAAVLVACGLVLLWLLHFVVLHWEAEPGSKPRKDAKRQRRGSSRKQLGVLGWVFAWSSTGKWKFANDARRFKKIGCAALALLVFEAAVAVAFPSNVATALWSAAFVAGGCLLVGACRQVMLNHILRAPELRPEKLSRRQEVADQQQRHVCAVYRRPRHREDDEDLTRFTLFGEESPFIGAGEIVYQWNPPICIQLLRPADDEVPLPEREHPVPPFQADELVDHLRQAVEQLNFDTVDVRLPVQVNDRVYVAETDVASFPALLPARIDESRMRAIINSPGSKEHHFLEIVTPLEGAEFVATVLLHIRLQGRTLSISTAACVLAHTPRQFQRAEEFGQNGAFAVFWTAFRELFSLPAEVPRLWRLARYLLALAKAALLSSDLTATPIRNVLVGTRVSTREWASQAWSKVQLEKTEILGRMKIIEQRLLRSAGDFLYEKDVDNSDFNDRALKIINSGIFNFGDNNTISSNAVGDGSQAGSAAGPPTGSGNQDGGK
ncbi:hypothetical protein [Streptomyces sp. NPDC054784]